MERLRTLTEDECYLRCYGWVGTDDAVRLLPCPSAPPLDPWLEASEAGERLRRLLELRLDTRETLEAA
jgi:hypothetical protein